MRYLNKILVLFWLFFVFALPATCLRSEEILTQDEAIRIALKNNPDLQVLIHRIEAVRTGIKQAREFAATSIDLDFDGQETIFRSGEIYYGFSQEIEFPTRIGLRVKLARQQVATAETEQEQARWEVAVGVKELYQQLALSSELVSIARENLAIAERLHEMATQKYGLGSVGKLDVLRAGVEAATATDDLLALEQEQRALRMGLNYLLGRDPTAGLTTTEFALGKAPDGSLGHLVDTALSKRFELKAIRSRMTEAELMKSLARSEYYPDFAFGFARHQIGGENDSWDITASISIPIFGREAISGRVAEAQAELNGLDAETKAVAAAIELEVREAHQQVVLQQQRVKRFEDVILAQAEEAFRIAQASYREGEIESLELLESQRTLQETRQGFAGAIFQHNLALIRLERAIGSSLGWEANDQPTAENAPGGKQ